MEHARRTRSEILAYIEGRLRRFTVPVVLGGTPFQRAVWGRLQAIPYGGTRTYGEIAAELGRPRAARAVGTACGSNPVAILVPCHRIVAGNGGSAAGKGGGRIKAELLELERTRAR
jgi:methylated-DNA-[protein]-cysteine S-methyltransferase